MSDLKKRYRDRAARAMRELLAEQKKYGHIHDGGGKRYLVGVYYLLAGELQKSVAAFDWLFAEFPDDIGEPVCHLYSALAAFRNGQLAVARAKLRDTMLSNIYLLPGIVGKKVSAEGVWHSSNQQREDYLDDVGEFFGEPNPQEREWIARELNSPHFKDLMAAYIETWRALRFEQDIEERRRILAKWGSIREQARQM